ncbi:hypothetical protein [Asanoa siamensis]|uniref:ESAT-6 protein secretion system EspG family protein n=1 Tax=Asanoa siamensis TaxID=926357 RepID=A0ABQ4CTC8_9ACTN|nr:hypothetical protein [Asanoa siamensis]GIF74551.1 hypothetical protein Asi02nite_40690 [Asanoa siamensis]
MTDAVVPRAGMTISIRSRRDVVVVDPDRFLAAARQAAPDVSDVYDAVHALLDRDGDLAADVRDSEVIGVGGPLPGIRVTDRPDGLSPAGRLRQVVVDDDARPLQDYGCFLPDDPFALPRAVDESAAAAVASIVDHRSQPSFPLLLTLADGYFADPEFEDALARSLRESPALVERWETWSADQRGTPSAYLEGTEVGWFDGTRRNVVTHPDGPTATADFIHRLTAWRARRAVIDVAAAE